MLCGLGNYSRPFRGIVSFGPSTDGGRTSQKLVINGLLWDSVSLPMTFISLVLTMAPRMIIQVELGFVATLAARCWNTDTRSGIPSSEYTIGGGEEKLTNHSDYGVGGDDKYG